MALATRCDLRKSRHLDEDISGLRFSRLTVLRFAGFREPKGTWWDCQCDCGASVTVLRSRLKSGATRSCGCLQREMAAARGSPPVTICCAVCGRSRTSPAAWLRKVKTPTCSRRCNGVLRRRRLVGTEHLGRASWTEGSLASFQEKMSGKNNPNWKGGVTLGRPKGNYIGAKYVRCPSTHREMARSDGYVMEHRLVMAMWIGRTLSSREVVHHVDHNPRNNLRENLELWPCNSSHRRAEYGHVTLGAANLFVPRQTL